MSHNYDDHSSVLTENIRKKRKYDVQLNSCSLYPQINLSTSLQPCHDLLVHKTPEFLAKKARTISSAIDYHEQLFEYYSDNHHELISLNGILHFCNDLSIEPNSYEILLFCFLCRAKKMYSLTKNEFLTGLKTFGNHINNLFDLRTCLFNYNILPYEKEFYIWIYYYGLIDGQRCLTIKTAINLWHLFYSKKIEKSKLVDQWLNYLENNQNFDIPKTITIDTWTLFPEFIKFIQLNGYESYNANEAWPLSKPTLKPLKFGAESMISKKKQYITIDPIVRPTSSSFNPVEFGTREFRLPDGKLYKLTSNDLIDRCVIGEGNFGVVCKMEHEKSGIMMAVKRIRSTVDEQCQKQMLVELDIVMRENTCPHIIQFYGALFKEGDCWICMELMNTSLDYFYKYVYHKLDQCIPESVLAYIALATLEALDYIKSRWRIIHRDVKPSNILVSRTTIKLCDFGISGQLIDSIAKTRDAGCRPYLPPERLDPARATCDGYDVRSDVWSFGITLYEISTGYFPFREWKSVFDQLQQIVEGPSLELTTDCLSDNCKNFVNTCLNKDEKQRPKYKILLEHPFVRKAKDNQQVENAIAYLSHIIDGLEVNTDVFELYYYLPSNSSTPR